MWGIMTLMAVGLSLDALAAAFSYTVRGVRIPYISRWIIGICSLAYALLALWAGETLARWLPGESAKWIGAALLAVLGIHALLKSAPETNAPSAPPPKQTGEVTRWHWAIRSLGITVSVVKDPLSGDLDGSRCIDAKEACLLGLALSVDAISVGMGAALSGVQHAALPFLIAGMQVLLLSIGCALGSRCAGKLPQRALRLAPGCILLCIALARVLA